MQVFFLGSQINPPFEARCIQISWIDFLNFLDNLPSSFQLLHMP